MVFIVGNVGNFVIVEWFDNLGMYDVVVVDVDRVFVVVFGVVVEILVDDMVFGVNDEVVVRIVGKFDGFGVVGERINVGRVEGSGVVVFEEMVSKLGLLVGVLGVDFIFFVEGEDVVEIGSKLFDFG